MRPVPRCGRPDGSAGWRSRSQNARGTRPTRRHPATKAAPPASRFRTPPVPQPAPPPCKNVGIDVSGTTAAGRTGAPSNALTNVLLPRLNWPSTARWQRSSRNRRRNPASRPQSASNSAPSAPTGSPASPKNSDKRRAPTPLGDITSALGGLMVRQISASIICSLPANKKTPHRHRPGRVQVSPPCPYPDRLG